MCSQIQQGSRVTSSEDALDILRFWLAKQARSSSQTSRARKVGVYDVPPSPARTTPLELLALIAIAVAIFVLFVVAKSWEYYYNI